MSEIEWSDALMEPIVSWVEAAYPEEGCGLVLRDAEGSLRVMTCENLANRYHELDPETFPRTARTFYIIDPMEFVRAERRGEEVAVVFHSHADVGDYFSDEDIAAAVMPRFDEEDPVEPAHPGTDYLVVSVREGRADHATLFRFDEAEESFLGVSELVID